MVAGTTIETDGLSLRIWGLHPATWLLCWVAFLFVVGGLPLSQLITAGTVSCLVSLATGTSPWSAIRRIRWVLVCALVIYALATPGTALWPLLGAYSPTFSGLALGAGQALRLAIAVVSLGVVLAKLGPSGVLTALDWLLRPLAWLGCDAERFITRLWLTLYYVEPRREQSFTQLLTELQGAPATHMAPAVVVLHRQFMDWRDACVLGAMALLLVIR